MVWELYTGFLWVGFIKRRTKRRRTSRAQLKRQQKLEHRTSSLLKKKKKTLWGSAFGKKKTKSMAEWGRDWIVLDPSSFSILFSCKHNKQQEKVKEGPLFYFLFYFFLFFSFSYLLEKKKKKKKIPPILFFLFFFKNLSPHTRRTAMISHPLFPPLAYRPPSPDKGKTK